jgi:AAA15 family ATPase/GTPase
VAGKTNFFKAIQFAKTPMVSGTRPDSFIPIEVFRLDNKMANQPSWFIFTLLADNTIYEFTFSVTRTTIMEEKLTKITRTDEKVLYDRRDGKLNFNNSLPEQQALDFTFRGTWDNQLFLTNSVFQNISTFRPVYNSTVRVVMESSDNRLNQRIAITRKDGDFIAKNLLPITKKRMARKSNLIFTRNSMAHSA